MLGPSKRTSASGGVGVAPSAPGPAHLNQVMSRLVRAVRGSEDCAVDGGGIGATPLLGEDGVCRGVTSR